MPLVEDMLQSVRFRLGMGHDPWVHHYPARVMSYLLVLISVTFNRLQRLGRVSNDR